MTAVNKTSRRFPQRVFRHGTEPDARFSLANERTFLAWIRTSLAFLAGGVALESLGLGIEPTLRLTASILLITTGILTPLQAWLGWVRSERALRLKSPLPSAAISLPIGIAVVTVGLLLLLGIALR